MGAIAMPQSLRALELKGELPFKPTWFPLDFDWAKWAEEGRPPSEYNPPQLRTETMWNGMCVDTWSHRTTFMSGCIPFYKHCTLDPYPEHVYLSDPDDWFTKMLKTGDHPNCPEFLKGIWWLQDNSGGEVLITFHDAEWVTEKYGRKLMAYNWTNDASTPSGVMIRKDVNNAANPSMSGMVMTISPDGKWINIDDAWIYVVQPGDVFKKPDGSILDVTPGADMIRLSWRTALDPSSELIYQYRVRRVAYLDNRGDLVKTDTYKELLAQVNLPTVPHMFGGWGYCNLKPEDLENAYKPLCDRQMIRFAPPPVPRDELVFPTVKLG